MAAIIPLVLQGLTVLPGILGSLKLIFGTSNATAQQKADALTSVAGTALQVAGAASTGGQAETMAKAQQVLPMFHDLTENLMMLAEASGQPGDVKQQYVTNIAAAAMQGWEQMSTGGQATTVEQIKPVVQQAIDTLVPIIFPKEATVGIENLQPSE